MLEQTTPTEGKWSIKIKKGHKCGEDFPRDQ